jgi:hypothetical protein
MGVPANWPDHLEAAIQYINNCILPNLKYSPNDLLLTLVVNTKRTPTFEISAEPTPAEVKTQVAYADQQPCDGYAQIVDHAHHHKAVFSTSVSWTIIWERSPSRLVT